MCDWLMRNGPMAHKADGWQLASDMNCSDDSSFMTTRWVTAHVPVSVVMITLHPFPSDGVESTRKKGKGGRPMGAVGPCPVRATRAQGEEGGENNETKDVQNKTDLSQKGNGGKWMHN